MPKVSKAEFARNLNVSGARVSQYIAHGLPVLEGGKIDLEAGTKWVAENFRRKSNNAGKGADRAEQNLKLKPTQINGHEPPLKNFGREDLIQLTVAETLKFVVLEAGKVAARMSIEAGGSMPLAYALDTMVSIELGKVAKQFVSRERPDWPFGDKVDQEFRDREDAGWAALAKKAGEPTDLDGWASYLDSLPWSQPPQPQAR